jgi:CRP-like cAMP-binding protein
LLARCTAKELARVDRLGAEVDLQPGRTLTRQGAEGCEFFMVRDGVAVARRGPRRVGAIGAGSVAGELALLDGTVRTATVVTVTPMRVVVFTAKEFEELLTVAPCIEDDLALIAAGRRALLEAAPQPSHDEAQVGTRSMGAPGLGA